MIRVLRFCNVTAFITKTLYNNTLVEKGICCHKPKMLKVFLGKLV